MIFRLFVSGQSSERLNHQGTVHSFQLEDSDCSFVLRRIGLPGQDSIPNSKGEFEEENKLRADGFNPRDMELEMCVRSGDEYWVRAVQVGGFDLPEVSAGVSDKLTMAVLHYVSSLVLNMKGFKFLYLLAGERDDQDPTADHLLLKEVVDSVNSNQAIEYV